MFLEFNWTANCYQPRFGDRFTAIDGRRFYISLNDARQALKVVGLKLGRKTDTRTWKIVLEGAQS